MRSSLGRESKQIKQSCSFGVGGFAMIDTTRFREI